MLQPVWNVCYNPNVSLTVIPLSPSGSPSLSSKLALAAEALETYRTSCFWSLTPEFKVSEATLPLIVAGLRKHGDRAAFVLAARLCR